MKKNILLLLIFVFFAFGFGGNCYYVSTETGNPLFALLKGFLYDPTNGSNEQGFIDLYYIAAGAEGKVYTTVDPATGNWSPVNSGTTNDIYFLKNSIRSDTTVSFGVGESGTIIRSLNMGATWSVLNSGISQNLYGIDFIGTNLDYMVAVGESGTIIRSTNLGETWNPVSSGVTKNLNTVYSFSSFITYAAGDDGTLLRSSNSGLNWINVSLPDTVTDLNRIGQMGSWFFGNIYGIVGDGGKLYRTLDNFSWNSVSTGTDEDLFDLQFRNASSGYVCGTNGTVRYTIDGGNEWFTDPFIQSITNNTITSSIMINDTTAAATAGNNIFVTYANEGLLPVELISFTSAVNRNDVTLEWITQSEINNSGFSIERKNENMLWNEIGFVNGSGTVSEPRNYSFTDRNLQSGNYSYRLKQVDVNGNFEYFNLSNEVIIGLPQKFVLNQNYPNPFNPVTKVSFEIPFGASVRLAIYDVSGKEVDVIANENLEAGYHEYEWNAESYSSGIYFCKIFYRQISDVKKMMLVK